MGTNDTNGIISGNVSVGSAGIYGINNNGIITAYDINFSNNIYKNGSIFNTSQWTSGLDFVFYTGKVGIGKTTITTGYMLDVNGDIKVNGTVEATSYNAISDHRIKTNIEPLSNSHTVDRLNPVSYYNVLSGKNEMGFIAREVEDIYPMLVNRKQNSEQYQSINYNGLIAVAIKEIKDLKTKVNEQETLINHLIETRGNNILF